MNCNILEVSRKVIRTLEPEGRSLKDRTVDRLVIRLLIIGKII
jgi:hypothetical protein